MSVVVCVCVFLCGFGSAPPKGLDDEEYAFVEQLEERRRKEEEERSSQAKSDRNEFLAALASRTITVPSLPDTGIASALGPLLNAAASSTKAASKRQTRRRGEKRAADSAAGAPVEDSKGKEEAKPKPAKPEADKKEPPSKVRRTTPAAVSLGTKGLTGLAAYDSDSESDSDSD